VGTKKKSAPSTSKSRGLPVGRHRRFLNLRWGSCRGKGTRGRGNCERAQIPDAGGMGLLCTDGHVFEPGSDSALPANGVPIDAAISGLWLGTLLNHDAVRRVIRTRRTAGRTVVSYCCKLDWRFL
jgi:hypothetical protein